MQPVLGKWRLVLAQWRLLVVLLTPLLLLPLLIVVGTPEARAGYVMLLTSIYWMTEALPLAVTALIPAGLLPLMKVLSSKDVCMVYMTHSNMTLFCGIVMALAVEHCRAHERIALCVILKIGHSPRRLMVGFIATTMLLSMWISNTAATALMIPIVDAMIIELKKSSTRLSRKPARPKVAMPEVASTVELQDHFPTSPSADDLPEICIDMERRPSFVEIETISPEFSQLRNTCLIATAAAANIGGIGTLTGTVPNIVLAGFLSNSYGPKTGLNYATWMLFSVPTMLLCTLLVGIAMVFNTLDLRKTVNRFRERRWGSHHTYSTGDGTVTTSSTSRARSAAVRDILVLRYNALGRVSFHEKAVIAVFAALIVMWFMRSPEFIPGWGQLFDVDGVPMVSSATPALVAVVLLFIIPAKPSALMSGQHDPDGGLLTWKAVQERMPWQVLLIMGGGFALAAGAKESGLSAWIGNSLKVIASVPSATAVFLMALMTTIMTTLMSNTAVIAILLPILKEVAVILEVNPLYLMIPATLSASFAFMLPVATPPNALVYAAGSFKTADMAKIGFVLNVLCMLVLMLVTNTLGDLMFDFSVVPSWANTTAAP
ncbi:solute carrier family 13 member 5 isoform X2 [Hyalella azteca]|uniref:Solute carrier family 13 member 5 isoform X2 n=1 Tax=Hyalella azteca TaxID=294128 RepID=A0A8B7NP62_HYAAZ|nr:solute carrier family 13 member 5 isoform X2 [Hyalella azteca]